MKKYIKSSADKRRYIGGKLSDLPAVYNGFDDEAEMAWETRSETQNAYVNNFNQGGHFIVYRPNSHSSQLKLLGGLDILYDISETMRIKDGIDVVDCGDYIELVGYYTGSEDIVRLYPIGLDMLGELSNLIEESDFDENTVIANEIAQYTWNGASVDDVLKSWA